MAKRQPPQNPKEKARRRAVKRRQAAKKTGTQVKGTDAEQSRFVGDMKTLGKRTVMSTPGARQFAVKKKAGKKKSKMRVLFKKPK